MSRPKREKPGLAATGGLSKKQSGAQHKTGARGVNITMFWPLMPFLPLGVVVLARWIGGGL